VWNATLVLRALGRNDINVYVVVGGLIVAVPVLLLGISLFGLIGAITGELVLILLVRLSCLFMLNRISGLRLEYAVGPRAMLAFYRRGWHRGLQEVHRLTGMFGRRRVRADDSRSVEKGDTSGR
jgi:hypothetical protein